MIECPKCKHVLEDHCDFCPYCGQSLASKKEKEKTPLTEDEIKKTKILRIVGICI